VKETLQSLVELQRLEDSLRDLRALRAEYAALVAANQDTRELFSGMLGEREEQLSDIRSFCDEKNKEIKESEDNARRARGRMSSIRSQRELTALNKELDTARRLNLQRSEELLKLMEQLDTAQADYEKKTQEFGDLQEQMTSAEQSVMTRIKEGEADSQSQTVRREEIRGTLDRAMLSRFDRILGARKGAAVAFVQDGICSACRMAVAPQIFQRLMRVNTLESCQNCGRFLVWEPGLVDAPEGDASTEVAAAEV